MADIDGLVTWHTPLDTSLRSANLASWLGFGNLRFAANPTSGGGNLSAAAVGLADAAVTAGYANNVVVYRSLNQGEKRYGRSLDEEVVSDENAYRTPFGLGAPAAFNAVLSTKYMHDHGVRQDALAEIALASYAHAQNNPRAIMYGKPLTREQYHASRWIAEPFHLYDCCQESDGACAMVVTSSERAADAPQHPAFIQASANGMVPDGGLWGFNDGAFPSGRYRPVGEELWQRAGVRPTDIDVAQFYENFTGTTMMAIADLGFCEPGELNDFLADGRLRAPDGGLPINTSGGNLAEAYIHGLQLVNEAVRQVRNESVNQVPHVELSLSVAGPGTPPGSTVLFSRSRP
ncbi:acetyl-CoA acetyltransferase [Nocardioides immobilis]|uniref:Acetyl-CoA acetyltransferase n=2 Tax=Nocardioides immobilis TaxID=2049295 RepID=A0A417XTA3_9ACTN|nr:acetyl-CoA acetyltransferase [Nocardioides immobilis]